ncbi:ABC transporter substrate-binding protein [bacterium]|nr:ABC transporter substrate-binding protein [bacterium]
MNKKTLLAVLSILLVGSFLLSACQNAATPAPTEEDMVEETEPPVVDETEMASEEAPAESDAAKDLDVYRIAMLADMTSSNVWNLFGPGASTYNYVVQALYWPTLYGLSDQRFDLIPFLASDFSSPFEEEGEFFVTTIGLKEGFTWSDGSEVTADDLAFTAQVVKDFQLGGNWDYWLAGVDHIEAVDSKTAKIYYTSKPGLADHEYGVLQNSIVQKAFWEPKLADAYLVIEAAADMDPESDDYIAAVTEAQTVLYGIPADGEPIAGPFMYDQWEVGAFVENAQNNDYFFKGTMVELFDDGTYHEYKEGEWEFTAYGESSGDVILSFENGPFAKAIVYSIYNQDAAVLALLNGEVDYIYNPNGYGPGLRAQLDGNSEVQVVENARNGWRFMAYNFRNAPLDDIAARQAIACMINKDFLTQSVLQGAAIPVNTPVPVGQPFWYNPDVPILCDGMSEQERMEWSINLLKEAGYTWDTEPTWNEDRGGSVDWGVGLKMPNGEYVPELTLLAPSAGYDPLRATAGVMIEQWAQSIGFPVNAQLTNFNNILNETLGGGGNWDMAISGWSLTQFPDHMCDFFLVEYGADFAFGAYENDELSQLCSEFKSTTDLEYAKEVGYQMQDILATELPYVYLFANPVQDAFNLANVEYPYLTVLGGLENLYGMQINVYSAE